MPLGTLERSAPSFLKQGPSPRSRLALYSALALFLMVADARFQVTDPLRKAVAVALYPLQWAMLQPVEFASKGAGYFQTLQVAQADADTARRNMAQMSERANQAEQLLQENARLRKLLDLRERLTTPSQAAQVIYDAADPYTRRVMIDQGQVAGVELGSPVMDESGMLGQVTRVHPFLSEVTLLIDRDQAIPVMNLRTGARSVAYGDPVIAHGGGMEPALHARQCGRAGKRPAHHQRRGRPVPAGAARGPRGAGGAARRLGLRPHLLRAAGAGERGPPRAGAQAADGRSAAAPRARTGRAGPKGAPMIRNVRRPGRSA